MAFITPVQTTLLSPVIGVFTPFQINGSGITYNQFLNSLGKYNYGSEFFYLSANNYQQIGQTFTYNNFDANGNSVTTSLAFAVDPYQSQPSIFHKTESDQIILTGLSSLQFNLLPQGTVYFKFFATITYLGNELDDKSNKNGNNAFEEFEKTEGINFFDDYCNYLIDNE